MWIGGDRSCSLSFFREFQNNISYLLTFIIMVSSIVGNIARWFCNQTSPCKQTFGYNVKQAFSVSFVYLLL